MEYDPLCSCDECVDRSVRAAKAEGYSRAIEDAIKVVESGKRITAAYILGHEPAGVTSGTYIHRQETLAALRSLAPPADPGAGE